MIKKLANNNIEKATGGLIVYDDGIWYVLDNETKFKANTCNYNELKQITNSLEKAAYKYRYGIAPFKTEDLNEAIAKDIEVNGPNAGREYVRYTRPHTIVTDSSGEIHRARLAFNDADMFNLPRYAIPKN